MFCDINENASRWNNTVGNGDEDHRGKKSVAMRQWLLVYGVHWGSFVYRTGFCFCT